MINEILMLIQLIKAKAALGGQKLAMNCHIKGFKSVDLTNQQAQKFK